MRINVPQKNFQKFKEVLIYILNSVGAKPNIGETVIYKLLYFIDFDYYEKHEEQLDRGHLSEKQVRVRRRLNSGRSRTRWWLKARSWRSRISIFSTRRGNTSR